MRLFLSVELRLGIRHIFRVIFIPAFLAFPEWFFFWKIPVRIFISHLAVPISLGLNLAHVPKSLIALYIHTNDLQVHSIIMRAFSTKRKHEHNENIHLATDCCKNVTLFILRGNSE